MKARLWRAMEGCAACIGNALLDIAEWAEARARKARRK